MQPLTEQELHNLAMNIVGKDLESNGFEFMAVNSKLKKNPQFVCLKNKKLHFVIVKAVSYPDDPANYDPIFMQTIKEHAIKFKARCYYAGVGLANTKSLNTPLTKKDDYTINYKGLIEIK